MLVGLLSLVEPGIPVAWLDPGPYFGNPWDQPCPGDASRQSFRLEHHDGTDRDFQYQDQSGKHDPVLEELS